ncbi:phosphoenolpyruvate--protein phosphotransferase [Alicyclobacillus macrosporangiidus]|uniref:Phosphoenolpyruvate-protein phosphotransferase n=1 Tax=Alicyclobacillus macrosporangiidus TaxID=392015 RepID=A0A1I7L910_9BACL|nr:phosphoenolpyruvate--protein phosphotransferase [Alicyclobacillus macrosporangiidus]SFV06272.1 phosphotransferase system, enzyme I, PtsI [Alicyclobacillus macrosporangiidus]
MATRVLQDLGVSPGLAVGTAVWLRRASAEIPVRTLAEAEVAGEQARFRQAVAEAEAEIGALRKRVAKDVGEAEAQVFDAHLAFLGDPAYTGEIERKIVADRVNAEAACRDVTEATRAMLASLPDEYLAARADDICDVGSRLLRLLQGVAGVDFANLPEQAVVVADELVPSDLSGLPKQVVGFVVARGSKTAHTAILARTMRLPAVYGLGDAMEAIADGQLLVVDGDTGFVMVDPSTNEVEKARQARQVQAEAQARAEARAHESAVTRDGRRIEVFANVGKPEDADAAVAAGADGVGLFRTEFLYFDNDHWPTEEEQYEAYRRVLEAFGEKPVIIRTLDIGGDKQLPYAQLPVEENPFLGLRGIRYCLAEPDVFRTQLRALLRASVHGTLWVMFPMVENVSEFRAAKEWVARCKKELEDEGVAVREDIPLGIMVETPAAALTADVLAREVDFFSIGTNDLTQYTLAADRGNTDVASLYDPLHPAVLRLIRMTCVAAEQVGIPVGMCGEMAGDAELTELLVGLGLQELSMSSAFVPLVKERVRGVDTRMARAKADAAAAAESPEAVRAKLAAVDGAGTAGEPL